MFSLKSAYLYQTPKKRMNGNSLSGFCALIYKTYHRIISVYAIYISLMYLEHKMHYTCESEEMDLQSGLI